MRGTSWRPTSRGVRLAAVLAALTLAGCTTSSGLWAPSFDVPEFRHATRSAAPETPRADDFLAIDDAMRTYARDVLAPIPNPRERVRRLASDLIAPHSPYAIRYSEARTLTASEVFRLREGNCLSFTALVVQLARLSGLEAHFQDVPVLPQWHVEGGTFVVERHVDAVMPLGALDGIVDFRPPTAATYTRATVVSDANATAQYLGNLGVERFTAGDLEGAYWLYRRGLEIDRRAATLWLNLGVVFARSGQLADAERAYRTALSITPGDLSGLNNLALLLEQQGDADGAARLHARVERYRLRNPYYLYWQGERALQSGDPAAATGWYARAAARLPKEADFQFALARSHLAAGQETDARRSLQAALDLAQTDAIRARYRVEFAVLAGDPVPEDDATFILMPHLPTDHRH